MTRLRAGVERLLADGQTYAEIQIDTLVQESGVAKSTFYAHLADKGELLRLLGADILADLVSFEDAWWTLPVDAPAEQVRDGVERTFAAFAAHGPLMVAVADAATYDREMREQFRTAIGGAAEATAAFLDDARRAGVAPPGLDVQRTAFWLAWMFERGFAKLLLDDGADARERHLDALTDIVCGVLGRRGL